MISYRVIFVILYRALYKTTKITLYDIIQSIFDVSYIELYIKQQITLYDIIQIKQQSILMLSLYRL